MTQQVDKLIKPQTLMYDIDKLKLINSYPLAREWPAGLDPEFKKKKGLFDPSLLYVGQPVEKKVGTFYCLKAHQLLKIYNLLLFKRILIYLIFCTFLKFFFVYFNVRR